jgi:hypothetical protein
VRIKKVNTELYEVRIIKLSDIDYSDQRFQIHTVLESEVLRHSIRSYGILEFPLFLSAGGKLTLCQGFRRIEALRALNKKTCMARVVTSSDITLEDMFMHAVQSNVGHSFSDSDKILVLSKAKEMFLCDEEKIMTEIMPVLGLPATRKVLYDYLECARVVSQCPRVELQNKMGIKGLRELVSFSTSEQELLFTTVLHVCHFSASDIKNLKESLDIIMKRDSVTLEVLMKRDDLTHILSDGRLDPKQKAQALLAFLKKEACPEVSGLREVFYKIVRDARLPKNVTFLDPCEFEASGYSLLLRAQSFDDLKKTVASLGQKCEKLKEIFSLERRNDTM